MVKFEDLTCDCCGDKIIECYNAQCVMTPNEVFCMSCFRGDNSKIGNYLDRVSHDYYLKYKLENKIKQVNDKEVRLYIQLEDNIRIAKSETKQECICHFNEILDKGYELALKSESASAIELIKSLKKEMEK